MKIHQDIKATMKYFRISSFRSEQIKPIAALRKGKNIFVNMPTSSGKSLIYQLPAALYWEKLTIVVKPTIALMLDQMQKLKRLGLAAAYIGSSLTKVQRQELIKHLYGLTFLYTTPERIIRPAFIKQLKCLYGFAPWV